MRLTLLTHYREIGKRSNTGQLVLRCLGDAAEQVQWSRTVPPPKLLKDIAAGGVALVWPGADDHGQATASCGQFIVIDGTWLSARKIFQRSPYLHALPRVSLVPTAASLYNLRPNQKPGGLCTAECVVAVLQAVGRPDDAARLQAQFLAFIKSPTMLRGEARARDVAKVLDSPATDAIR